MPPSFSRICSLGAPQSWGSSAHLAIKNIGSIVCFKTEVDETFLCTPQRCCRTPTRPRSPTPVRQRLVHPAQTNVILINMSQNVHLFLLKRRYKHCSSQKTFYCKMTSAPSFQRSNTSARSDRVGYLCNELPFSYDTAIYQYWSSLTLDLYT